MKNVTILCMSVFISIGLFGCQGNFSVDKVVVADNYIKSTPRYQKPGASVSLSNSQVNLDVSGVQYSVDLGINSRYGSGDMEVTVSASEGLYIVGGQTTTNLSLSKGEINIPYVVTASEVGRHYIYANVKVNYKGKSDFRALTLIVQVGEQKPSTNNKASSTKKKSNMSQEENVDLVFGDSISLPANEEIIQ